MYAKTSRVLILILMVVLAGCGGAPAAQAPGATVPAVDVEAALATDVVETPQVISPAAPATDAAEATPPAAEATQTTAPAAAADKAGAVKIEFWYGLGGKLGETVEDFIKRFNEAQNEVQVVGVVQPDYGTTAQKLQAAIAARNPPALVLLGGVDEFIDAEALLPLDDLAATHNYPWDDLAPAFLQPGMREGKHYTIPLYGTTQVMYYRKDFFEELDIDPEEAFKNWQNLVEAARKCTVTEGGEVKRYGWEPMWGSGNLVDATLSAGGKILSDDGTKVLINDPTWIEVWDSFRKWIHEDKIMRIHYGGEGWAYWYRTIDDVMQGRACGYIGSSGDQGDLDFNIISAHIQPGWKDHPPAPGAGGLSGAIPAGAPPEQQEAAFKFLMFWTQPDMTAEWSVRTGYMPVRLSAVESPVLQKAAEERPAILVPPQQLQVASPSFLDPTDGKIWDALSKAADKVEIEGVPAAEALNAAAEEAQAALDEVLAEQQ